MAFLFSSSHQPASRVRRPHLEDDDDNENREALPRSGGVQASSHLEGRMPEPEAARSTGGSPAPRSSGAGIDWMGRLKELVEQPQQRRRADSVAPDSGPRSADEEHEPDAGADHDEDEIPGGVHDEAPEHREHEDTSSWYHPPESGSYHPDSGFNVRPEDASAASPDHGFDQHPPESEERGIRDEWGDGAPPSAQEWGVSRNNEGRSQPQSGQRSVGPDVPAGSIAARPSVATTSRLFEKRSVPEAYFKQQQQARGAGGPTAQQRLQRAPQAIAAQPQVPGANPPAQTTGGKPAVRDFAVSTYRGHAHAPEKMNEGSAAPPNHIPESKKTGALRPGRSTDPGPKYSIELDKIEDEMRALLLARRAAYDKIKNGNMPLTTDELTKLMELDYQRGLRANGDSEGMTYEELTKWADDEYFYRTEVNRDKHPGHEGFRGAGFALVENPEPKFDNPHIKHMARGYTDPYFGWEINYNVVGQWLRIAGYSKAEAGLFLNAWLAKTPEKWGSNFDRQTWFWIGYDYADARQKGWHPAAHPPEAKPANDWQTTPPPLP